MHEYSRRFEAAWQRFYLRMSCETRSEYNCGKHRRYSITAVRGYLRIHRHLWHWRLTTVHFSPLLLKIEMFSSFVPKLLSDDQNVVRSLKCSRSWFYWERWKRSALWIGITNSLEKFNAHSLLDISCHCQWEEIMLHTFLRASTSMKQRQRLSCRLTTVKLGSSYSLALLKSQFHWLTIARKIPGLLSLQPLVLPA